MTYALIAIIEPLRHIETHATGYKRLAAAMADGRQYIKMLGWKGFAVADDADASSPWLYLETAETERERETPGLHERLEFLGIGSIGP